MLRISGVLAFLFSGALGILLFSRVHTFQVTGTAHRIGTSWSVEIDAGPGAVSTKPEDVPRSLPPIINFDNGVAVVGFSFQGQDDRGLADNARIVVTHRSVDFRPIRWALGSTELKSKGRITYHGRSVAALFSWIGLIAAVPFLCWLPFALGAFLLRKPSPPPLYGDDGLVEPGSV